MLFNSVTLNGDWGMNYQQEKYTSSDIPKCDFYPIKNAVPGYWEDMTDAFQLVEFFGKLRINPEYGIQRYPMTGYCPDMALPNIIGNFFYKRSFILDEVRDNATLYFTGVQNAVSVWVNDTYLGRHEGYSSEFEFTLPENLLKNGENTIIMSVSNYDLVGYDGLLVSGLSTRAVTEGTGGITGDMEIRFYNSTLRDVALFVAEDCSRIDATIVASADAKIDWEVYDGDKLLKSGSSEGEFSFDTEGLDLWCPENPKMYVLKLICGEGSLTRNFGVRRLLPDGVHFKLNGYPYFLRGICEHCYYPDTVHSNHDKAFYRSVIKKIKELGFNFIRFHTCVGEEEYLQAADELGMLVHIESPNNTSLEEWKEIVNTCRRHPSVVIYCCGNELQMDEPRIAHLNKCADVVHAETDALFSPMSAMRGLEYCWIEPEQEEFTVEEPFKHHPSRIEVVGKFSDLYSSYANGRFSYDSHIADPVESDEWSRVYNKPRVSHEICIDGTYTDLSLKDRYKGKRIGKTEMFSSIEEHLESKGVLEKAPLYFRNSSEWQRRIRKFCFEELRRSENMAGYDFLGPIDTHWHTFGYDVGMMNEFYELKPGETERNVLMYNSETVVLTDLSKNLNLLGGSELSFGVYTSCYHKTPVEDACLTVRILKDGKQLIKKTAKIDRIENGKVSKLYDFSAVLPAVDKAEEIILSVTLDADELYAENQWEMYVFPEAEVKQGDVVVSEGMELGELTELLKKGKKVVLFGTEPFASLPTSFKVALAGRTSGNVATVIADHPLGNVMPNKGFCGWQFAKLLEGGNAVCFNRDDIPFNPIIEVVSTHKNVVKQSILFEFKAFEGSLIVCGFNFEESDPGARWLRAKILEYATSDLFDPIDVIDGEQLLALATEAETAVAANTNLAFNANDKTAQTKKK